MRKYLQLAIVLSIFFAAVLARNLTEEERPAVFQARPADGGEAGDAPVFIPALQPTPTPPSPTPTPITPTPEVQATPVITPIATATPIPSPTATRWPSLFYGAKFNDGVFTGKPARITYGNLQVQVLMRAGIIENVLIVEYPLRTPTSERVSAEVIPLLISQAIALQDWDVDVISGATQTTQAFQKAMVYALREAEQG
ncbi:MAG: FMN-binding protein [Chloroflexi bacterium]|nr:FMN-binding protein [Chloroflexota bacterium]